MTIRLPPLSSLRAFEAFARLRSVSAAADDLCVTHSAVLHQLKRIQDWIGVELYSRGPNGLELTMTGERYRITVCDAFAKVAAETEQLKVGQNSTVNVACLPMFGTAWLLMRLPDFWAKHPTVSLRMHYIPPDTRDFGDYDLWIGLEPGADAPSPGRMPLFCGAAAPVCSPDYLRARAPIVEPCDLLEHTLVHDEDTSGWLRWFKATQTEFPDQQSSIVKRDGALTVASVMAGEGIGLLRPTVVSRQIKSQALVLVLDRVIDADHYYFLGWRHKKPLEYGARMFRDWISKQVLEQSD